MPASEPVEEVPAAMSAPTPSHQPRFVADLDILIRARYPLIYLVSWEEQRLDAILQDLASAHGKVLLSWSITRGLRRIGGSPGGPHVEAGRGPAARLAAHGQLTQAAPVGLKGLHSLPNAPT